MTVNIKRFILKHLLKTEDALEEMIVRSRWGDALGNGCENQYTLEELSSLLELSPTRIRAILARGCRVMAKRLEIIDRLLDAQAVPPGKKRSGPRKKKYGELSHIRELGPVSRRLGGLLQAHQCQLVREIIQLRREDLQRWPGMGKKSLRELELLLARANLSLSTA